MITISLKLLLALALLWFFLLALWFTLPAMLGVQTRGSQTTAEYIEYETSSSSSFPKVGGFASSSAAAATVSALHNKRKRPYELDSYNLDQYQYRTAKGLIYDKVAARTGNMSYFKLGDLLSGWNTDDTSVSKWANSPCHPNKGVGVPRLDYMDKQQYTIAQNMRNLELPFILYNIPDLDRAVSDEGEFAIERLAFNIGDEPREVEESEDNHFMYFVAKNRKKKGLRNTDLKDWTPPQKYTPITFPDFMKYSEKLETETGPNKDIAGDKPLYYMIFSATEGIQTPWIRNSFPMFSSKHGSTFFIVDPSGFKGINCRIGMKGVNAAAHYDGGRNFIAMVRGRKRYILLPPSECQKLSLLPRNHPSSRHSDIDWSDLKAVRSKKDFYEAKATEVVISPGDMLYIPSFWFHYIVSQDASIQCNARSGSHERPQDIIDCGF